jgi:flagellar hook-basal body complex protein FliE
MIQFNPSIGSTPQPFAPVSPAAQKPTQVNGPEFNKVINKFIENVDKDQQNSATAIKDLLSGKTQDINSVVTEAAKADMSFKLLVGVRNKVIEAYKQTMQMQI